MAFLSVKNIELTGIAACVPKDVESNYQYDLLTEKERELFIKTTGIENRRIAPKDITASDLCFESAKALIHSLNIDKSEIDIILFVSQSPDYFLPATSIILQDRLGLAKSTMAFDIQMGCSGYVYGLSVISNLMSSGNFRKGLLLVGDKSSLSLTKTDKSAFPLFSDAGSATLLNYNTNSNLKMDFNLQSDGSGYKSIIIEDGGSRNPFSLESEIIKEVMPGIIRSKRNLVLEGIDIFNFSMREVAPNILDLLKYNQTNLDDYDFFVFHQANKLINDSIQKKLKLASEKIPSSLKNFGNTSCTSIPLTIVTELKDMLKERKSLLFSGFGVGLSWGSVALQTENLICLPLIEI